MRILHTSDWHLGRSFHGVQLLDAQVTVLESLVRTIKSESVDVLLIAGDIYDRAIPSADAVKALSHLLSEIRGAGAQIIGISGNHDSADRIGFAESIMSTGGVCLRGDITSAGNPVILADQKTGGSVAFFPIPYLEIDRARHAFGSPETRSHDRLLKLALDKARANLALLPQHRSVAIVHAFVTGGQESDSELALTVGGSSEVPLKGFRGFDYVALGHLHGRQSFGDGKVRYSGSPLPYSFSERNHTKGTWLIDLPSSGQAHVTQVDFENYRPLSQIKGELQHLLEHSEYFAVEQHFIQAILSDQVLPLDAMNKLRSRFPHAVLLQHEPPAINITQHSYSQKIKGRTDIELATDFVEHVAGRSATNQEVLDLTQAIDDSSSAQMDSASGMAVA